MNQKLKEPAGTATGATFSRTLADLSKGAALDQCSEGMQAIVKAVKETGMKGTLTLKINIELGKDEETVTLTPEINIKVPKQPIKPTLFFATEDYVLTREDPRQHEMNFAVVEGAKIQDAIQQNQVK